MIANLTDAISKYGQAAGLPKFGGTDDASTGGVSFGDILKQTTQNLLATQGKAEAVGQQAAVGKANLVDVMTSINNAQVTLQTVVSVRDRLVDAIKSVMATAV